jgi:hypothetical protein
MFKDANCDPLSDWGAMVGSDRQCVCAKHEDSILIAITQKVISLCPGMIK